MIDRPTSSSAIDSNHPPGERFHVSYCSALFLSLLVASLTWNAGFFDDDSVISLWKQQATQGGSMWAFCWGNFRDFIVYQGRFVPVFSFGLLPLLLAIGDDLPLYRLYFSSIYVISFLFIQYGLSRLFQSRTAATIALAAFVANIQLQNYHDPYTSYFAYLPVVTALMVGAMSSFCRVLESAKYPAGLSAKLVFRHLLWVLAALATWEVAIVIAATTSVQALFVRISWRQKVPLIAIPAVWGILFVLANLVLKRASINTGTVVSMSSLGGIGHAYWVQLAGTFPFTLSDAACPSALSQISPLWSGTALAALVFGLILLRTLQGTDLRSSLEHWRFTLSLVTQGLCLILVPPALTAITAKYQVELQPGMAYLQVFVQNLGLAILFGTGALVVLGSSNHRGRVAHAVLVTGLLTVFSVHTNRNLAVIEYRNAFWREPRELTAAAMSSFRGEADAISSVLIDRSYLQRWENRDLSMRVLGKSLPFSTRSDAVDVSPGTDRLYVNYTASVGSGAHGLAHVGRVDASLPLPVVITPRDNTIVVTRPFASMPSYHLEFVTLDGNLQPQHHSIPIPAPSTNEDRYFTVAENSPIQLGSVRLVISP